MPELPEVEHFRQILLPLVSTTSPITFECPPPLPTKRFPTQDTFDLINQGQYVTKDVLRKGKLICIILQKDTKPSSSKKRRSTKSSTKDKTESDDNTSITGNEPVLYLSLHMGMTGRISSPTHIPELVELKNDSTYPPPHTHLIIKSSNGEEAAFSDPRRFGSVLVDVGEEKEIICEDDIPGFKELAPDALDSSSSNAQQQTIVDQLLNRKKGIKGLLLDQKAVVSGVGNWVADEILYRCHIHPDQSYLNMTEARNLVREMNYILSTAVTCLNDNKDLPEVWLFHRRWRGGGGGGSTAKDYNGKAIKFIQSGGRSSAVVLSLQKLMGRKGTKKVFPKGKQRSNETSNVKKSKVVASKKTDTKGKRKRVDNESSSKRRKFNQAEARGLQQVEGDGVI